MSKQNLQALAKDKTKLTDVLQKLDTHREIAAFLEDVLTPEELTEIAQRLEIAQLVLAGRTYDEITAKTGASSTTVSRIAQTIKYGNDSFKKIFGTGGEHHGS